MQDARVRSPTPGVRVTPTTCPSDRRAKPAAPPARGTFRRSRPAAPAARPAASATRQTMRSAPPAREASPRMPEPFVANDYCEYGGCGGGGYVPPAYGMPPALVL